jgi:hypothetical protein
MRIKFNDLIKKILTESIEQIDPRVRQFAKTKGYTVEAFHGSQEKKLTEISKSRTSYGLFFSPDPVTTSGYTGDDGKIYHVLLHAPEDKILDLTDDKIRYDFINEYMGSGNVTIVSKGIYGDSEELSTSKIVDTIMDSLKTNSEIANFLKNKYPPEGDEDFMEWIEFSIEEDAYSLIDEPIIWKLFEDDYIKVDEEANHILNSYGSQDFYWNYQNDMLNTAHNEGYFLVVFDDSATTAGGESISYVVFNPNNIKLADTQTFDSQGNEIPLEKRFNRNISDIRY